MNPIDHIVLAFCINPSKDPVSPHVLARVLASGAFAPGGVQVDGRAVLHAQLGSVRCDLLQLDDVLSHDYPRYAPVLNQQFGDADAVIVVNWHEGKNAPDPIFTVQTTGDMETGAFSPVDPAVTRALFLAVEAQRQKAALGQFSTWMEATHWSGPMYGAESGKLLSLVKPSVIDLEIGSSPRAWSYPAAAEVLARALLTAFVAPDKPKLSLLGIGGTHFEAGFTQLLRDYGETQGIAFSHLLPNHWLVAHRYELSTRLPDLLACARSIKGGVDAVAYHDNLKSSYKHQVQKLASELGVPAFSHRKLRTPDIAELIRDAQVES